MGGNEGSGPRRWIASRVGQSSEFVSGSHETDRPTSLLREREELVSAAADKIAPLVGLPHPQNRGSRMRQHVFDDLDSGRLRAGFSDCRRRHAKTGNITSVGALHPSRERAPGAACASGRRFPSDG